MNQTFKVGIAILVFFGIFAAGAVTGLVVTAHFANRHLQRLEQDRQEEQQRQEEQWKQDQAQNLQEQQKLIQMIATLRQQAQHPGRQGQPQSPGQFGPQLFQRLVNQIKPTTEQREQIRPLVYQAAEDLRRLRRDTAHSTELILEQLQDRISTLLTPEQRDRFEQMIDKSREAFKRYDFEQQMRQEQQRQQEQRQKLQEQQEQQAPAPALEQPAPQQP